MSDKASTTTIIVADTSLRIVRINEMTRSAAGRVENRTTEATGCDDLLSYIVDIERLEALDICRTILAGKKFPGGARSYRKVVTTPDVLGERWVLLLGPHYAGDGPVDGVVYAKFRSAEPDEIPQRDLDPEKFYEYLVENSSDMVCLCDTHGRITFANKQTERIYGAPTSEILGKHFSEFVHPDDIESFRRVFEQTALTGESSPDHHFRIITAAGEVRHMLMNGGLIAADGGDRLLGVCRDVTESMELRESLLARNQALSALNNIVVALSSSENLDDGLNTALERILGMLELDRGAISLVEANGGARVRVTIGVECDSRGLACPLATVCAENAQVTIIRNTRTDTRLEPKSRDIMIATGFDAVILVPLKCGTAVTAVLSLGVPPPAELAREQMDFINLAAGILGPVIQNARLHNDIADRVSQLAMLERLARSINAGLDVRGVLVACLKEIAEMVEFERVSLIFVDANGEAEIFRHWTDAPVEPVQKTHLSACEAGMLRALSSSQVIHDISKSNDIRQHSDEALHSGSAINVPLKRNDQLLGVLKVWHSEPDRFGERELRILEAVAEHLAIASSNARLFQAERAKSLELAAIAREAHHRIKNNLQMITGLLSISGSDSGESDRAAPRCLRQIRAIATVHDMLTPRSTEPGVSLRDCLKNVAEQALMGAGRSETTKLVVRGNDCVVSPDAATALSIIVNELVCNAAEHAFVTREHGSIVLAISRTPDGTTVDVGDDGVGLSKDFVMPQSPDSGLGLVTSLAMYGLGGKVSIASTENGTTASVRF